METKVMVSNVRLIPHSEAVLRRLSSRIFFMRSKKDELYGELGNDRLYGGDGDDILLGDIGHSLRRYSGTVPLTKSGGAIWHKDIILEEHGNITSIARISQKINTSIINAESIASASLLFVSMGYENGTKANSSGVWPIDLFTFKLDQSYDDILSGGMGDDLMIGQRGNDKLFTGAVIQTCCS